MEKLLLILKFIRKTAKFMITGLGGSYGEKNSYFIKCQKKWVFLQQEFGFLKMKMSHGK